jgi:hypothetical protein
VTQIQTAVVSFYGQYDAEGNEGEQMNEQENEAAPADAEGVEAVIDAEGNGAGTNESGQNENPEAFENIETGVLQQDLATHEPAPIDESAEGEVLDLGRVEGLSAAPSTLRGPGNSE